MKFKIKKKQKQNKIVNHYSHPCQMPGAAAAAATPLDDDCVMCLF